MPSLLAVLVFAGLLLSLAGDYTKTICKISDLGKDGQVIVLKGGVLVAQYQCRSGICENQPNNMGQLKNQSDYLVLIIQNISRFDRFFYFIYGKNGNIQNNFTFDDVPLTSATPDLTHEALTTSVTQTEPLNMSRMIEPVKGEKQVENGRGVVVVVVVVLVVVVVVVVVVVADFNRRFRNAVPNPAAANHIEMVNFLPDQV
ncbi:uncharacterized protein [Garra rufa]|uniref:uncharacterized protein n=1 Tax=Garra rufa TaxID=137080 RepID=UPI003CCEAF68